MDFERLQWWKIPNTNHQRSLSHTPNLTAICDALHSNLLSPKTIACTCTKHQNVKYVLNLHCKHILYTVGEIIYNADMEDKGSVDVKIFSVARNATVTITDPWWNITDNYHHDCTVGFTKHEFLWTHMSPSRYVAVILWHVRETTCFSCIIK
jgi:hypothetical protein